MTVFPQTPDASLVTDASVSRHTWSKEELKCETHSSPQQFALLSHPPRLPTILLKLD